VLNRQIYDMTLVVQTETIVFFLFNKIKFSSTVLIFGSRSMVTLLIGYSELTENLSSLLCSIVAVCQCLRIPELFSKTSINQNLLTHFRRNK